MIFMSSLLILSIFGLGQSDFSYPPIPCSVPCVVEFSPGGIIDLFAAQGRQLAADKTPVIVDGPCLSACTILVDEARDNVCITKNAVLGYHQSVMMTEDGPEYGDIIYKTPGLNKYIQSRGGLPKPNSGHLLILNQSEAGKFYKTC